MKIAIHHRPGSYSDRWIEYCEKNSVDYKIVNVFDNDIIQQIADCDALMWHHHHAIFEDVIAAKKILFSLEHAGITVFPNFNSGWHFDDKVAQKYLLEAISAPLVSSYVFYNKKQAKNWAKSTEYPKVFKLKGGAGASNVELIYSYKEAVKKINQAFGKGFPQFNRLKNLNERIKKFNNNEGSLLDIAKGISRLIISTEFAKKQPKEKGYIYFQDFIPNNDFDIRVIVVGDKAFAIKRLVRDNDFRASGSNKIIYDKDAIDERCIKIAFAVNEKLNTQSIAYDFVFDSENNPLIIEICYCYSIEAYDLCPGYWDSNIVWHQGSFNPQEWMIEQAIDSAR